MTSSSVLFRLPILWLLFYSLGSLAAPRDTTPDQFRFDDMVGVALSVPLISNAIVVTGINAGSAISVSGGQYSRNGGAFTAVKGTVSQGDSIRVRHVSASANNATVNTTLTIGGVKDTFSSTTFSKPPDTTPDPFAFADQAGVPINTSITSNEVTVSGIDVPAPITVQGGLFSINTGGFQASAGTINNGDSVRIRLLSASSFSATTQAILTIGGVSGSFKVTTLADPNVFLLPPASGGSPLFASEHFSGSGNCTLCHNNISDGQGKDVSIETDWSSTMMANSTRDPLWRAKVRSELNRNGHLAEVINDKCSRCHAPMANFEARKAGEPLHILDGGFLSANHNRHDEALNGVGCALCHQIQNAPNLGTLSSFTGKYEIGQDKLMFGPFPDIFPNPMIMHTGYTPTFSPHIKDSKLCGTCHNLKTPYVDEAGAILSTTPESEFPEQMPYSEWEHSSYATSQPRSCQQCHMARANGAPIANRPMWLPKRDGFALHEFVGGNKLMLDIFDRNKAQLGVLSSNFQETIAKTEAMLQGAATIVPLHQTLNTSGVLDFALQVNSQTGHKLPSGYPARRVILHVMVKDAQGNLVFESGKVNADGSVAGVDADSNPLGFEPHHELITSPEQVQVYEAIMGDSTGQVTYTLLRGARYLKDNRLLPAGFDKTTAPSDIQVAGDAMSDANFVGGSDQVRYRVTGLTGDAYQVTAELIHQPLAYRFAQDLFGDVGAEIRDFQKMFRESNAKSTVMTSTSFMATR